MTVRPKQSPRGRPPGLSQLQRMAAQSGQSPLSQKAFNEMKAALAAPKKPQSKIGQIHALGPPQINRLANQQPAPDRDSVTCNDPPSAATGQHPVTDVTVTALRALAAKIDALEGRIVQLEARISRPETEPAPKISPTPHSRAAYMRAYRAKQKLNGQKVE